MIRKHLQDGLKAAGCTLVLYENEALATVVTDMAQAGDTVGLVLEPTTLVLKIAGNGVQRTYPPVTVEILRQVRPEDTAVNNEQTLENLLTIAATFVNNLAHTQAFHKIGDVPVTKVTERRYDANLIGWSLALTLKPVDNQLIC